MMKKIVFSLLMIGLGVTGMHAQQEPVTRMHQIKHKLSSFTQLDTVSKENVLKLIVFTVDNMVLPEEYAGYCTLFGLPLITLSKFGSLQAVKQFITSDSKNFALRKLAWFSLQSLAGISELDEQFYGYVTQMSDYISLSPAFNSICFHAMGKVYKPLINKAWRPIEG